MSFGSLDFPWQSYARKPHPLVKQMLHNEHRHIVRGSSQSHDETYQNSACLVQGSEVVAQATCIFGQLGHQETTEAVGLRSFRMQCKFSLVHKWLCFRPRKRVKSSPALCCLSYQFHSSAFKPETCLLWAEAAEVAPADHTPAFRNAQIAFVAYWCIGPRYSV